MPIKSSKPPARTPHPLDSVQAFQAAADEYLRRVMSTPGGPRGELVEIGIYTKAGKLSKNYQ